MKVAAMLLILLGLGGCAVRKPPTIFVLRQCQTIEAAFVVENFQTKERHEELVCQCSRRSEKLDAKTGKLIIECQ